jgi:hypothetical protein
MNIGPSLEQERDCLKASSDSSPHDRRGLKVFASPLRPGPSLEQKGCLGPVVVVARPVQLLVQVRHFLPRLYVHCRNQSVKHHLEQAVEVPRLWLRLTVVACALLQIGR